MSDKAKILIVDDEPDVLETLKIRLEAAGYDIVTVSNSTKAFEKVKQELPNLVICDIMMPGIDGFQVLELIKKDETTRHVPVVMLSAGKDEEEWAKRSLKLGSAGYVVKPFETDSLLFTVSKFAKKR